MTVIRWGIAGCGRISNDFATALQHLGRDKHIISAVAARSKASAEEFGKKFDVAKHYGSYEEMAKDEEIDAVYIGTINNTHLSLGSMFLNHCKPVLCEKPLAATLEETKQFIALAKAKNVFLMEAMRPRCSPLYQKLESTLANKDVGDVVHAFVSFGVPIPYSERYLSGLPDKSRGCVLDIGIYAINFILLAMGDDMPISVKSKAKINEIGVDTETTVLLEFPNNRFGTFITSTNIKLPNAGFISGSKGTIKVDDPFWCATSFSGPTGTFDIPLDQTTKEYIFENAQDMKYEAEEVRKCLEQGRKESALIPHHLSLKYSKIMHEIRKQAGVLPLF